MYITKGRGIVDTQRMDSWKHENGVLHQKFLPITSKASKELRSELIRYQTMHREDSRLSETPEPSIVSSVPLSLPMDAFNYVQFGWKWYVLTRVGHDILQTRSRSEKALDLAVGPP